MKKYIVITTINPKSKAISQFERMEDWKIILVGDKKSSEIKSNENVTFLSVEDQINLKYNFVKVCPYNHYARKNIGYLYAIKNGADVIYDTDDDNIPIDNWNMPKFDCKLIIDSNCSFINIYKYFTNKNIWPRGFPLDEIIKDNSVLPKTTHTRDIGIWQGLVDNEPDVDAIYRLTHKEKTKFYRRRKVMLNRGTYCPSNSQNTFWSKNTFPFLYLPSTVSFRFTDILRGYIAQRLLWEQDSLLGFMNAAVIQERNTHYLMKDFADEVECYLNIKSIISVMNSLKLGVFPFENLQRVYKSLSDNNLIDKKEIVILNAWLEDLYK